MRRKLAPQIGDVGSRERILEDFFDDRLEVGEGADGPEGAALRRTASAAHRGQEKAASTTGREICC